MQTTATTSEQEGFHVESINVYFCALKNKKRSIKNVEVILAPGYYKVAQPKLLKLS